MEMTLPPMARLGAEPAGAWHLRGGGDNRFEGGRVALLCQLCGAYIECMFRVSIKTRMGEA